jgi:hypothetical protein
MGCWTSSTVSYRTNLARVRISSAYNRYVPLHLSSIEKDDFLAGGAQQITCLEPHTKGRARNLYKEKVALLQPSNVAPVNILGADRTVSFPGIIADQVAGQYLVAHFLQPMHNLACRIDTRTVTPP